MTEQDPWADLVRAFWAAFETAWPPDRPFLALVLGVGLVVGLTQGLGLWAPLYGLLLMALWAVLLFVLSLYSKGRKR